ncbi:MAG: pseudouridine synthase [Spongiibacteraceae bacterium]
MKDRTVFTAGVRASAFHLPQGSWATVLDCLCANFPTISREQWCDRMARGRVFDAQGATIDALKPYQSGLRIYYFREVPDEQPIPVTETVLYADDHLIVVDKPHFLPVMPAGSYVEETLQGRLMRQFHNSELTPLHRLDRHTAGLVLVSVQKNSRALYQSLFREQKIQKYYEAIAPALPQYNFPLLRATRIVRGEPFFRSQEINGIANSETRIEVSERHGDLWRYALYPVTGKKHQLRVHMAALGAPICNDPIYPDLRNEAADNYSQPLKLLARSLFFIDPLTGVARKFESRLTLDW